MDLHTSARVKNTRQRHLDGQEDDDEQILMGSTCVMGVSRICLGLMG